MKDLHTLTDELGLAFRDFEQAVLDVGWGCAAEVPMGDGEFLRFGKFSDKWQLQYIWGDEVQPLTNAPRDRRIAAVQALPDLLVALARAYEDARLSVIGATERLRGMTLDLRTKTKKVQKETT